jgi:hypothetical protein
MGHLQHLAEQLDRHGQAHRGPGPVDGGLGRGPNSSTATVATASVAGSWANAAPSSCATWWPAAPARSP